MIVCILSYPSALILADYSDNLSQYSYNTPNKSSHSNSYCRRVLLGILRMRKLSPIGGQYWENYLLGILRIFIFGWFHY